MNRPHDTVAPTEDAPAAADPGTPPSRPDPGESPADEVARTLERVHADALATLDRWEAGVRNGVTGALRGAFSAARDQHARLLAETAPADDSTALATESRALRTYREGLCRDVLAPLAHALEELRPARELRLRWNTLLAEMEEVVRSAPVEMQRDRPAELYEKRSGDGLWTRFKQGSMRTTRRAAGLFGSRAPRVQRIPFQMLASGLLRLERVPGVVGVVDGLHRHHAQALGTLEEALRGWFHQWFPAEAWRDQPTNHLSPELLEELTALQGRLDPVLRELQGISEEDAPTEGETDGEGLPSVEAEEAAVSAPPETSGDAPPSPWDVARTLQTALDLLADWPDESEAGKALRTGLDVLRDELALSLLRADSALEVRTPSADERHQARHRDRMDRTGGRWEDWSNVAAGRTRLALAVLEFRNTLDRHLDRYLGQVAEKALVEPIRSLTRAQETLGRLQERLAEVTVESTRAGREVLAERIREIQREAESTLEEQVSTALTQERTQDPVRAVADRTVEALSETIRGLPEEVKLHARPSEDGLELDQGVREVNLRELFQQSLDILRLEAVRNASAPVGQELEDARVACQEIPRVIDYNVRAAREELLAEEAPDTPASVEEAPIQEAPVQEAPGEETDAAPPATPAAGNAAILEDARSLTADALARSVQGLEHVQARLLEPWFPFADSVHRTVEAGLIQVHERLTMQRAVQEQFRDVRTLVLGWLRRGRSFALEEWGRFSHRARRLWQRVYVHGLRLVRKGRALGIEQAVEGEAEKVVEVLRGIPALLEPLPLVYRRLFSFQPVTDPALLVGREEETAWVNRRYATWQEGIRAPSLLVGPSGVGQTSLLNVLGETTFRDARVVRISFPHRPRSEEALAARLLEVLKGAEVTADDGGPLTFDHVAHVLRTGADASPDRPLVLLVEHLPHLVLRTAGGFDLAVRFLDFQMRTSPSVFWLSAVADTTWKLFRKAEPRAASLMIQGTVSALDRAEIERLILTRHQRSGVPLDFLVPDNLNPLLRRKLQRTGSEEARQSLLQADFFDRLYRSSRGNAVMAILLWLKSADFAPKDGWLQLRTPRPIRFGFLDELDLALDFALKALMEHGSLTLDQYAEIFRVSDDDAYQTFETLRVRMLLEPWENQGAAPKLVREIQPGVRYRVPPILTDVVSEYLRRGNIQH